MEAEPLGPRTGPLQLTASATVLGISVFLLVIAVYTPGTLPFFAAARLDADFIVDVAHNIASTSDVDPSFAATVSFYNVIGSIMDVKIFLALVGCLTFWSVYRKARTWNQIFLAAVWTTVSIILVLNTPGKDVIAVCLTFATAILIRVTRGSIYSVIAACVLYGLYAWIFRAYYVLIISAGIGFFLTKLLTVKYRAIALVAVAIIVFTAGGGVITALQASRDEVNTARALDRDEAQRTAFNNPLPPATFVGRIGNFGFAALRLTFPVIWGGTIKDLLFGVYSISLIWTVLICLRSTSRELQLVGSLLVGSILISIMFEPDVGSFARHSCTMFPFLFVIFRNARTEQDLRPQGGLDPTVVSPAAI